MIKTLLSKKTKIMLVAVFAVMLFALVNFSVWDNANADDSNSKNGKDDLYGEKFKKECPAGYAYRFHKGGTNGETGALGNYYLDVAHNPTRHFEDKWYDFKVGDNTLTWDDKEKHPWKEYNLYFGGGGNRANNSYQFKNLRFVYSDHLDAPLQSSGNNCFGVKYDLKTPFYINDETQHFKIVFGIIFPNGRHETTWDTFADSFDSGSNCEVLERAGHGIDKDDNDHGYTFEQAAKDVGCLSFYSALVNNKIKVTVDQIECEQYYKKSTN